MESTPSAINVDLGELRTFAESLRAETDHGLRPGVARAEQEIQNGVRFGFASPGGQTAASRDVLAAALDRARENTARQVRGAEILTAAIEQVMANYTEGDQIAAQHLAKVEQAMSEAIAAAEAASRPLPPQSASGFQP